MSLTNDRDTSPVRRLFALVLSIVMLDWNMSAEAFDKASWRFPVEKLQVRRAVICLHKDAAGKVHCTGARLECEPLLLPDVNSAWQKPRKVTPHIMVDFDADFTSLASLAGRTLELGRPVEKCPDELGAVYLFGVHNPVGWQRIVFGQRKGKSVQATFDLYFDFDFEDRIGGRFRHTLKGPVIIEQRWLSKP